MGEIPRIEALDLLRGIAIIAVVLYHFGLLPFGHLGVELFFVLSGFLVSRPFVEAFDREQPLAIRSFFTKRISKILPSYYFFLMVGAVLSFALYAKTKPELCFSWNHLPRYLFFYSNLRGIGPWTFEHLWTLCIEEHFYLLLPLVLLFARRTGKNSTAVVRAALIFIGATWFCREITYRVHRDTIAGSQNRMDALAYGMLLAQIHSRIDLIKLNRNLAWKILSAAVGLLAIIIFEDSQNPRSYFNFTWFHSLAAIAMAGIVASLLALRAPAGAFFRFFAYISYNLYLWHVLFVKAVTPDWLGFIIYMVGSIAVAWAATSAVEVPCMKLLRRSQPQKWERSYA